MAVLHRLSQQRGAIRDVNQSNVFVAWNSAEDYAAQRDTKTSSKGQSAAISKHIISLRIAKSSINERAQAFSRALLQAFASFYNASLILIVEIKYLPFGWLARVEYNIGYIIIDRTDGNSLISFRNLQNLETY